MKKNSCKIFFILVLLGVTNFACAEDLITVDQALKDDFPAATSIEKKPFTLTDEQLDQLKNKARVRIYPEYDQVIMIYTIQQDDQPIGYAFEHTVKGKWGPIEYLLLVDPQGKILNLHILSYEEKRGRPIAKPRFTNQFIDKTIAHPIRLKKDIHGITGATISSRGITDGVRKLLAVFQEFR